jgi:DNA-binding MarR family transcriptional regulator
MDVVIDPDWRDLTAVQRDILTVLAVDGPANGTEVDRRIGTETETANTVLRNIQTLAEAGYIERERREDDNREWINRLTPEGKRLVRAGMVEI